MAASAETNNQAPSNRKYEKQWNIEMWQSFELNETGADYVTANLGVVIWSNVMEYNRGSLYDYSRQLLIIWCNFSEK
jgi:hypothetical protein